MKNQNGGNFALILLVVGVGGWWFYSHYKATQQCRLKNTDYAMEQYPVGAKGTAVGESNMIYREALENKLDAQCR